jgi:SHS2 domain-containing protein
VKNLKGFEFIEHTADIGVRARGLSRAEVFEQCALGMVSLMYDPETVERSQRVRIEARADDEKALLVAWLSEIIYLVETEGWAFRDFEVEEISRQEVRGWGLGEPLDAARHRVSGEVKAPTYHMLELAEREGRWEAQVIFDV